MESNPMLHLFLFRLATPLALAAATLGAGLLAWPGGAQAAAGLRPYQDEAQFVQALSRWREQSLAQRRSRAQAEGPVGSVAPMSAPPAPAAMSAAPAAKMAQSFGAADSAPGSAAESITNVQTAGVDEGGIVKQAGDFLVVLRRGRLFTVRVGGGALQPVAMTDAYAPGSNPAGAWYDEMLVSGSTVVVVGYSYQRGGTEIGLFDLDREGRLAWRATHHLRSFDYYSARNYASRLVGTQLVFYSPTLLQPWGAEPWQLLPGQRRWRPSETPADWQRILPATRIYRTDDDFEPGQPLALHTVTRCDLAQAELRCESSAVLGPAGRVFYVSQGSVYVWTGGSGRYGSPAGGARSALFRLPLDGSAPSGIKTAGMPIDQMSFLEDRGHLNVLLREAGAGEGLWGHERGRGRFALLRLPLSELGDGSGAAQRQHYRALPGPQGGPVQNRFVGDWLLWAGPNPYADGLRPGVAIPNAHGLRYAEADAEPRDLALGWGVERIEALGRDALMVGACGGDLCFASLRLGARDLRQVDAYSQPGAAQGETRTHGFFYRPTGSDEGLLGLPVLGSGQPRGGVYAGGRSGSAAVMFLRTRQLQFSALGQLAAQAQGRRDDGCKASCVDWYGNARPLFLGQRVLALMGYELVEGRLEGGRGFGEGERIVERQRVSFAPGAREEGGRYSPFN
jgi:hypothetical protein